MKQENNMTSFFKLLVVAAFMAAQSAQATQWGAFGGFNMSEYDGDNVSYDKELGLEVGATAHIDMGGLVFRTGAGYVQKNSSVEVLGTNVDFSLSYLEVPVTALFWINDTVGIFGGLNFDLNIGDDCEITGGTCTMTDPDSLVYNLSLGGHFKVSDMSRIEAQFELGLSDIATDTKLGNSIGARYVHMF